MENLSDLLKVLILVFVEVRLGDIKKRSKESFLKS